MRYLRLLVVVLGLTLTLLWSGVEASGETAWSQVSQFGSSYYGYCSVNSGTAGKYSVCAIQLCPPTGGQNCSEPDGDVFYFSSNPQSHQWYGTTYISGPSGWRLRVIANVYNGDYVIIAQHITSWFYIP